MHACICAKLFLHSCREFANLQTSLVYKLKILSYITPWTTKTAQTMRYTLGAAEQLLSPWFNAMTHWYDIIFVNPRLCHGHHSNDSFYRAPDLQRFVSLVDLKELVSQSDQDERFGLKESFGCVDQTQSIEFFQVSSVRFYSAIVPIVD